MLKSSISLMLAQIFASVASAQLKVVGPAGTTLEDLVGSENLVTIILKDSYARDTNLHLTDIGDSLITLENEGGTRIVYRQDVIREVRVQSGRVQATSGKTIFRDPAERNEQAILEKAIKRTQRLFARAGDDHNLRMRAASVAGATGSEEALSYLRDLSTSSNMDAVAQSSKWLYYAGGEPDISVLKEALHSTNRSARPQAALVAGLMGAQELNDEVVEQLRDPSADVFTNTVHGAGLLGDERSIVHMVRAITATDEVKGNATVMALSNLGGEEVLREMRTTLKTSKGLEWFRAVQVLYSLGDLQGQELMRTDGFTKPVFQLRASLYLAKDDYWDANVFLRNYLRDSEDNSPEGLIFKAEAASVLLSKGYVQAKTHLRELLGLEPAAVYIRGANRNQVAKLAAVSEVQSKTCELIGIYGDRSALSLLEPSLDSTDPIVAITAAQSIVAIMTPGYRERLLR